MSIEAMKLTLEVLEKLNKDGWILADFEDDVYASMKALRTAIEQAQKQDCVAMDDYMALMEKYVALKAQRQWVGLTDEEIRNSATQGRTDFSRPPYEEFYRAIEAKLKEKNS